LKFARRALDDVERLQDFLLETDPQAAGETNALICRGLEVLIEHPLIGRPRSDGFRELLISRGRTGYVAIYEHDGENDLVIVHAIRHQREAGFEE
jgi:addiction module RelE/StbE family toxin